MQAIATDKSVVVACFFVFAGRKSAGVFKGQLFL